VADPAASASELSLRERKKARLRRQLAEIALDLYRERGHAGTTVDEICRRAEISQPTFYNYYPSKEAILTEHALRGFSDLLRHALQEPGSLHARLQRYFAAIAAQMTRDRKLWHAIAVSNAYNPVRDPSLLSALEAGTRVLEQALEHGQEQGEITRSFSAQRLASMLEGIMLRVGIEWGAGFPDARPLADSMAEALAHDAAPLCSAMLITDRIDLPQRSIRTDAEAWLASIRSAPDDH
jgi:AcrR family transcriptional regulator